MNNFRTIDRQTGFLLPPSVDEWLPEKHLARFVVEVIDGMDLRAMSGSYRGSGSAPYHPRVLIALTVKFEDIPCVVPRERIEMAKAKDCGCPIDLEDAIYFGGRDTVVCSNHKMRT